MPIVSISLNDQILSELDACQKSLGFSGRSEIIRAGIRAFVASEKKKAMLKGNINAILLVTHNDKSDNIASELGNDYEDIIKTKMHSKVDDQKCMDLFVLSGGVDYVMKMTRKYDTSKYMDSVELVTF